MKKSILRISIALLCCILCFSNSSTLAAPLDAAVFACESRAYQDGYLEKEEAVALYATGGNETAAKAKLIAAIRNMDPTVDISEYMIPVENINRLINSVINFYPEFYYLDINNTYYTGFQKKVMTIDFSRAYRFSKTEIQSKNARIEAEVDRILARVDRGNMSAAEQALVVHDYFALHYEYDTHAAAAAGGSGLMEEAVAKAFRIDGLFLDYKAVCQGYALGYMYVLNKLNIPTVFVTSNVMNHGWNMVKIGDNWYHVDVTWDDPVPDTFGHVGHKNFLRGDIELATETDHYGWTSSEEATADFPGMFWEEVVSEMIYYAGKWYYRDGAEIISRPFAETKTVVKEVTEHWPYPGVPGAFYTKPIFSIGLWNGFIYYNTPTQIKKIGIDGTGDVTVLTPELEDRYIYGLTVDGNLLCYRVAEEVYAEEEDIYTVELHFTATLEENTVRIINLGSIAAGQRFYVAVYRGNELLSLRVCPVVEDQTEYSVTPAGLADGDKIRVFAWNGLQSSGAFTEIKLNS